MGSTKEPLMFLVISPCCKGFINSGVLGLSWSWEEKYDEKTHYHFLNYFHWWYSQRLMKINGIKASRSNLTDLMETSLPMECNSCRCCWVLSCCRGWSSIIRGPSTSSLPSFDVRRSFHSSDCLGTGWCFSRGGGTAWFCSRIPCNYLACKGDKGEIWITIVIVVVIFIVIRRIPRVFISGCEAPSRVEDKLFNLCVVLRKLKGGCHELK